MGAADAVLNVGARVARAVRGRSNDAQPSRVLLLRLERIGDLLMAAGAIRRLRELLPSAEIDLVIGSWNAGLAPLIQGVTRTELLDAPWLSREHGGAPHSRLIARAWQWRERRYDLAVNFEPDIRSNFLAWLSGAPRRIGFSTGGGGAFLTEALAYDPRVHVAENAMRLASGVATSDVPRALPVRSSYLLPPPASSRVVRLFEGREGLLVGLHASGGRPVKQWHPERFRELAARLVDSYDATVVFTGSEADRSLVDAVASGLPRDRVVDASGLLDLPELAWLLTRLRIVITGDTGPMHLAEAVGTPIVAIFGPSDPVRYGPRGAHDRIIRVDLPCSPCNRIRQPPERCRGGTPECLVGVTVDAVMTAVADVLGHPLTLRRRAEGGSR